MSEKINFDSEDVIALYTIDGKTMIGTFITYPSETNVGSGTNLDTSNKSGTGIFTKLLGDKDTGAIPFDKYYFVKSPAEIIFSLETVSNGTAKLNWEIIPFIFGTLKTTSNKSVVVAYEKSQIAISDAVSSDIDSDIINGYKEVI